MISVFNPSKDNLVVDQWIASVHQITKQYNLDDRAIVRTIASRLRKPAHIWYDTRQQITAMWTEAKQQLASQFYKFIFFYRHFKEAVLFETRPDQSLGDYCFHKLNKLRKLDLT